jgi:hypothetical protein
VSVTSRLRFIPGKGPQVPTGQEAGWASDLEFIIYFIINLNKICNDSTSVCVCLYLLQPKAT